MNVLLWLKVVEVCVSVRTWPRLTNAYISWLKWTDSATKRGHEKTVTNCEKSFEYCGNLEIWLCTNSLDYPQTGLGPKDSLNRKTKNIGVKKTKQKIKQEEKTLNISLMSTSLRGSNGRNESTNAQKSLPVMAQAYIKSRPCSHFLRRKSWVDETRLAKNPSSWRSAHRWTTGREANRHVRLIWARFYEEVSNKKGQQLMEKGAGWSCGW